MGIGVPVLLFGGVASVASGSPTAGVSAGSPLGSLNVVVGVGGVNGTATITSLTDSSGNSYQLAVAAGSGVGVDTEIWYCLNAPHALPIGGTFTAVTNNASAYFVTAIVSVGGANGGLDKTNSAFAGSVTTLSIATGTLLVANEIVFGANNDYSGYTTYVESGGFTELVGNPPSNLLNIDAAYSIVNATTSVAWAPTWTPSNAGYQGVVASFMTSPPAILPTGFTWSEC